MGGAVGQGASGGRAGTVQEGRAGRARRDHEVGVLDLGREHLADRAVVGGGEREAALLEQVVVEEIGLDRGEVDDREDRGEPQPAERTPGPGRAAQGPRDRQRLGRHGQREEHLVPASVACEAAQRGDRVLADRARQARVLEVDERVLDDPGRVHDEAAQGPVLGTDVVAQDDRPRGVGHEPEDRGVAQHRVDRGEHAERDAARRAARVGGRAAARRGR
ncbi:hypothetical protein D3C74_331920 [compost metagenome]